MVNICDKKRHVMLYILLYFHDTLIPLMAPATLMKVLQRNASVCLETRVIDKVNFLCTNYKSIHTKCDGSR